MPSYSDQIKKLPSSEKKTQCNLRESGIGVCDDFSLLDDVFDVCAFSLQVFTYPSLSPVTALSGMISPTTLSLIASPVVTPRTTPRSTPIPRWTTGFMTLDEGMDYNSMMASFAAGSNPDDQLLSDGKNSVNINFLTLCNSPKATAKDLHSRGLSNVI